MQNAHDSAVETQTFGRETTAKQESFVSSPFSTCGPSWRLARNSANAHSVNLVGMVHCIQSVSFSDFDRFLCKSVCCLAEGAVVNFLDRLRHFSILCRCHKLCKSMFNTLHLCSRTFVLVPTIREYTRGVRVFWQVYRTAYRSSRRQSADYFFCESAKFFAQNVRGECTLLKRRVSNVVQKTRCVGCARTT